MAIGFVAGVVVRHLLPSPVCIMFVQVFHAVLYVNTRLTPFQEEFHPWFVRVFVRTMWTGDVEGPKSIVAAYIYCLGRVIVDVLLTVFFPLSSSVPLSYAPDCHDAPRAADPHDQALIVSPVVHAIVVRILTSGVFWKNYHRLTFIVHLPLPLQIMLIRFLMKVCVYFSSVEHICSREDGTGWPSFTRDSFFFILARV